MSQRDTKFPEAPDLLSLMTAESGQVLPHADSVPPVPVLAPTISGNIATKADEELASRRRARRERRKLDNAFESVGPRPANRVALSPAAQVAEQEFLSVKQLARRWSWASFPHRWHLGRVPPAGEFGRSRPTRPPAKRPEVSDGAVRAKKGEGVSHSP